MNVVCIYAKLSLQMIIQSQQKKYPEFQLCTSKNALLFFYLCSFGKVKAHSAQTYFLFYEKLLFVITIW